jgi:hypothetical protein
VHSDQGSQYGSDDWQRFCRDHRLQPSMSRRGNCYDNAAMESFFSSLKKERIKRRNYQTREEARPDVFDYMGVFDWPKDNAVAVVGELILAVGTMEKLKTAAEKHPYTVDETFATMSLCPASARSTTVRF